MISENKWAQYGKNGLEVEGIVIHNTSSYSSANDIFEEYETSESLHMASHYIVDSEETIQVMPLTWCVYSTGKGEDDAFKHCIVVEICLDINEVKYMEGQTRAVRLIKTLLSSYDLPFDRIYFHKDFNARAYCPSHILDIYKTKKAFIEYMKEVE